MKSWKKSLQIQVMIVEEEEEDPVMIQPTVVAFSIETTCR